MKQTIALLLILTVSFTAFAGQKLRFRGSNPNWASASAWDPARLPTNGDTVFIPAGTELLITSNLDLGNSNITIQVAGTLRFSGGGARLRSGAATTYTIFPGGLVDGGGNSSQRIEIGGEEIWRASEGDVTGPAYASFSTSKFNPIVLPVVFSFFKAEAKNGSALLTWATAQEQNAKSFIIERSADGSNWVAIGAVKATGTSTTQQHYQFTDNKPLTGKAFYRIKQVDTDGRFEYTALRSITNTGNGAAVQIRAVNGQVIVQFATARQQVAVQLVTLNGQVIRTQLFNNGSNQAVLQSSFKGAVVVSVQGAEGILAAQQVLL